MIIDFATSPAPASSTSHASSPSPAATAADGLGVEAAREHAEALEQRALARRRAARTTTRSPPRNVWWRSAALAASAGEQLEALVEACRDVGRGHDRDPRRGQLDRQRDAVEPAADLGDRRRVRLVEHEPGLHRAGRARRRAAPPRWHRSRRVDAVRAGSSSAVSGHTCSPATPSASRLVARMRTPGHSRSSPSASRPTAATRCSQLSSTSTSSRMRSASITLVGERARRPGQHAERRRHHLRELLVVLRGRRARTATRRRRSAARCRARPGSRCGSSPPRRRR